jgi:hypothetical protein
MVAIVMTQHSIFFHLEQRGLLFCPGNRIQMCNYGSIVSVLFPRLSVYNDYIINHKEGNVVAINSMISWLTTSYAISAFCH